MDTSLFQCSVGVILSFLQDLFDKRRAFLTVEVVLLLASASANHVSDIHALWVHPLRAQFFSGDVRMVLKPNLALVPKEVGSCSPIDTAAFSASSGDFPW